VSVTARLSPPGYHRHRHASTVDVDDRAVDEGGLVAREVNGGVRDRRGRAARARGGAAQLPAAG
jgi:hypothetical protein